MQINTFRDFDYFIDNHYLAFQEDQFLWKPIDLSCKIVGEINTWQQSCPYVSVKIYILKEEKVIYKYSSFCAWDVSTKIKWKDEITGVKYKALFCEDKLQDDIEVIDNITYNKIPNELKINDSCNLIKQNRFQEK